MDSKIFFRPDICEQGKLLNSKSKYEIIFAVIAPHETEQYAARTIAHHYDDYSEQLWMVNKYTLLKPAAKSAHEHMWRRYDLTEPGDTGLIICGTWIKQKRRAPHQPWTIMESALYHELQPGSAASCPLLYLGLVKERNPEWREKVRTWNAERRNQLEDSASYRYERELRYVALAEAKIKKRLEDNVRWYYEHEMQKIARRYSPDFSSA